MNISNDKSNTLLNGTSGNDKIISYGSNVTIQAQGGNDSIKNGWGGQNSSISAGAGNDSIYNDCSSVTITGGKGNDSIWNIYGDKLLVVYDAGDGDDFIGGFNGTSTLKIASGLYTSEKSGDNFIVRVDEGTITVNVDGILSKINISGEEEKAINQFYKDDNTLIVGSNYADKIENYAQNVTILGNRGNDSIYNHHYNKVIIDGGYGNDSVENWGSSVIINAGEGNDSVKNEGSSVTITTGEGNDSIRNYGSKVTISSGKGNDSIYNNCLRSGDGSIYYWNDDKGSNVLFNYTAGDGNDVIYGFKANSTLSIAGGVYATTVKSGNDVIVSVGNGKVTLQGAANLSTVNIVETPVNKTYEQNNTTIYGTNANDTITNKGDKVLIQALRGNDSINNKAAQVSIDGGEGNDKITNTGKNVTITGGAGNDSINNETENVTILGGAGDDSINNKGTNVTINTGDGNDSIYNNAKSDKVSIVSAAGNDSIYNEGNNVTIQSGEGNDTILSKSTATSIIAADGNDLIDIQSSYENTIIGGKGSDTIKLDKYSNKAFIQYNLGDGNDVIEGLNGTSTLQIGNGDNTYSRKDSGDDIILTVEDGGKITLRGAASLSSVNIAGMTKVILDNAKGETLITGNRLEDSIKNNGSNVTINTFAGKDTIFNYSDATLDAGADEDRILNSNATDSSINAGAGDDIIDSKGGSRNTILGGKGNDDIFLTSSNEALVIYNAGDGDDFITDFNSTSSLQIGDGTGRYYSEVKDNNVIVHVGNKNEILLRGAATLSTPNILGEEQVTGINYPNRTDSISVDGTEGNDTIRNYGSNVTINALGGHDSIRNTNLNVIIHGGNGKDSINNESDSVTIDGGLGDDSIHNDGGVNVLFAYNAGDGNDLIDGFNEASSLSIAGGLYSLQKSGNDAIVSVHDEKITLTGAAALETINIIGVEDKPASRINNGTDYATVTGGDSDDTIYNTGYRAMIHGYGGNDSIKSVNKNHVTIDGGAGNDRIINDISAGKLGGNTGIRASLNGGDGNDYIRNVVSNSATLVGGDGDDTLSDGAFYSRFIGGKGNDDIHLFKTSKGNDEVVIYNTGDGNDYVTGFDRTSTLVIDGGNGDYSTLQNGNDIIVSVGDGRITLEGAASLSRRNIKGKEKSLSMTINNTVNSSSVTGTEGGDIITNAGRSVMISALGGNDSITNNTGGRNSSIDGGAGDDTIINNYAQRVSITAAEGDDSIYTSGNYTTIDGGEGADSITNNGGYFLLIDGAEDNDFITLKDGTGSTISGGEGNDTIKIAGSTNALIEYEEGDGSDLIQGFAKTDSLRISDAAFSTATSGNNVIVTVGKDKITLEGASSLAAPNIISVSSDDDDADDDDDDDDASAEFMVVDDKVTASNFVASNAYRYNQSYSLLNVNSALEDVKITNAEDSAIKANGLFGSAILGSGNVLTYQANAVALTSETFNDKISFSKDTTFNYSEIQVDLIAGDVISTNGAKEITFDNNSSANITALEGAKININSGTFTVNDLPINSSGGAGTITVEKDGLSFKGYGVQFVNLEVAKESYFGKLMPMTVAYNSADESYTIQNTACVKTLSNGFTKLTLDISAAEDYAHYEINGKEVLVSSVADNINVIEANGSAFKVQGKELDAEKIGRITLDEQITFSGTEIDFDGVKTNYALNKPIIYSLDGEKVTIEDAATVTTGEDTKTFTCEAGSYIINGRSFETSTDLTFTADTNEIRIPLTDAQTEIYFDGVKVSGIADGGEIVFDLANDKISIPNGAELNITSPDEIKLNLAAGNFTIDAKKISTDNALEITVDKDDLKVPLSENPVTINGAAITGSDEMTIEIDNTDALFFSILLPDGALVQNVSRNTFELSGKDSYAYFGDTNKKVLLTEDGAAYIEYEKENSIGVGFNAITFENVEILGNDSWTVETSGASGIDKITGIKDGAIISTNTEEIDAGDLRFEVETDGAGEFTICGEKFTPTGKNTYVVRGNSDGEIKVAPLADEFKDDDSEAAGKAYNFDAAGDYTVNGITFYAEKDSKAQTITRGVEFDLSTGKFEYDGLTLEGTGTAQIYRYNARLISLTDGAKVSGDDEAKYYNRQFEINGAVELVGKKFETDSPTRCALLNVQYTWEISVGDQTAEIPVTMSGFVVGDKYVQIKSDSYDGVQVVDGKLASIEGVKNSAQITGSGLSNVTILTTESGEFSVRGNKYKITGDSDGVTFITDSHGNISEINGLEGSVEGNFESAVSVNGKAIRLTGASMIKVTSDGETITEISNVAGDSDGTYRKDVRVYELGGAEKLTTSADGTIIFNGNKFETSAGKTFTLDTSGNISGIEKAQVENVSANVLEEEASTSPLLLGATATENFATINLSTTDGLEEVFGDFSEGLMVNGVLVKVTDSTNFVVKDDAENVYIETTAADTFTINGKTFKTQVDKTIFKLDASGNVSEIVTDSFYPDKAAYQIAGDFNDEIIFNGKKIYVKGTNDASIFLGDETLITIDLARNAVEVVESGGAAEVVINGAGEVTIGDKTFSTSEGFTGSLQVNSSGVVSSAENFVGTLSGELGGLELQGITIASEDSFSVTSDGEKVTAIENLQNGTFTSSDLDSVTINGKVVSFDDSETITIADGELKNAAETVDSGTIAEEILNSENANVISGRENVTLTGGDVLVVEDTAAKVNIRASKGEDTIYTAGRNVDIDLKSGGATKIYAAQGRATVENYNAKSGAAFLTEDIGAATYADGRLSVNSAQVIFADDAESRFINFANAKDDTQKVGFVSDDSKLDAGKESGDLILFGASNSTIAGGKGRNQIQLDENSESTILLNGRSTIDNFNASFDGGDKISVDAATTDFSFDGENVSVKSGTARATLQNIFSDDGAARILTLINGKETKTAIAQASEVISIGDDLADVYYGEKSGVDFSAYDETLTIDLSKNFYGINQVTVGGGLNTLISSSANETLTGNSDGTTEYVFDKNCGRDVIQNFNFDEDKINVGTNAVTNVRINSAGGVRMEIGNVGSVTLNDAQGKNFRINNFTALVDKNIIYDAAANYFVATAQNASVIVNESAEIWLDGSHGKTFDGDIRTLDASTAEGKTSLAGNDLDNTILAGNGDASLWGGNGGDDLLIGGAGKNTFFYLQGNGSDTISGAHDGDNIILSTVTLDQIASTSITGDAVSINFTDGGSLQVNGNANVTYQLADGSKYTANHEQAVWQS